MPFRQQLWIAAITAVLLVASVWISRPIGGLVAFIVVWTAGLMWLQGFRLPGFVRKRRKALAAGLVAVAELQPRSVSRATYRVWVSRFGLAVCYFVGIVPLVLGLLALAAAATQSSGRNDLVVGGFWMTLFGALMTRYARLCGRQAVRIDALGVEADQFTGVTRIAWDDIVAVAQNTLRMRGANVLTEHTVYSKDRSIRIPAKLENRDELMATILENAPASV